MLRIRIEVESPELVDEESLRVSEVLALVRSGNIVQLVTGVNARSIALQMLQLCLPQDVSAGTGKSLFSRIPQPIKYTKAAVIQRVPHRKPVGNRETT